MEAKKHRVYLTRALPGEGMERILRNYDAEVFPGDAPPDRETILRGVRGREALVCLLTDPVDREIMEAGPLRIIANYAAGYNNIDVEAATELGILVTNTSGVLSETTADLTWALLLSAARRIVEGDRFMREGRFKGWAPTLLLGRDIYGKTLGVIGAGSIGSAVMRRALGFGMRVLYNSRRRKPELEEELGAKWATLKDLLKESDFITIHVPLTEETYHLIGEREFRLMKDGAVLVNVARGPVVDEEALVEALKEGKLFSAALDVYEREPEVHPDLLQMDNVVLAPHIGSASLATRSRMASMVADSLDDFFSGRVPKNVVNPEVLEKLHLKPR